MANVRFENITVGYGDHMILKDFSLEVASGQIVCLVGPSGCGKTTLVRALLGLNKPETGSITVGDRVLFDAKKRINIPAEKRNIGIVFQDAMGTVTDRYVFKSYVCHLHYLFYVGKGA